MARSRYIYVIEKLSVTSDGPSEVIACFTVKHECATYIERADPENWQKWEVFRYPDGGAYWGPKLPAAAKITEEFFE